MAPRVRDEVTGGLTGTGPADHPADHPAERRPLEERPRPRGRRPAGSDTRGQILDAARAELAERGYDGATVRAVARRARVDPALVRHYFDDKTDLFAAAMVPVGMDPAQLVPAMLEQGPDGLGERLAALALGVWEDRGGESFRALFAALGSSEPHLRAVAAFLGREVFGRVAAALPATDGDLRMALVSAQVAGLLVARHVMRLPEITALSTVELARLVGPTLQAYLTGPLPERADGAGSGTPQDRRRGSLAPGTGEEHHSPHEE